MGRITKSLFVGFLVSLLIGANGGADSKAASLKELIEGARKEGQVNVMLPSSATPELIKALETAMNKRYGINIKVNTRGAGSYTKAASIAIAEHRTGTVPTFDATIGGATHILSLTDSGAAEPIEDWKALAPKGLPLGDKTIVPDVLGKAAFKFVDNFHMLFYNTNLISKADLPKTLKDLGDPKYKGKFAVPPYVTTVAMAILAYSNEKTLEIFRTWGKNKPKVLGYSQGANRVALGELWMAPFPNAYTYYVHKAAGDPVGMMPIRDLVQWTPRYMTVRTNSPHPNAARLWVLFNAGPEGQRIWEREAKWMNISYPEQSRAAEVKKLIDKSGAKMYSWVENEKTVKRLRWLVTTKEGRAYSKRLKSAIRKGR